jgi:hypothetical protein
MRHFRCAVWLQALVHVMYLCKEASKAQKSTCLHAARAQVTTEAQREAFQAALSAAEDWLYDEGEAEAAPAFQCARSLLSTELL